MDLEKYIAEALHHMGMTKFINLSLLTPIFLSLQKYTTSLKKLSLCYIELLTPKKKQRKQEHPPLTGSQKSTQPWSPESPNCCRLRLPHWDFCFGVRIASTKCHSGHKPFPLLQTPKTTTIDSTIDTQQRQKHILSLEESSWWKNNRVKHTISYTIHTLQVEGKK